MYFLLSKHIHHEIKDGGAFNSVPSEGDKTMHNKDHSMFTPAQSALHITGDKTCQKGSKLRTEVLWLNQSSGFATDSLLFKGNN